MNMKKISDYTKKEFLDFVIGICTDTYSIEKDHIYPLSFKLPLCWLHSLTPVT
ncbi:MULTISPECIES: bacteriocin immunity protein [unclassified Photorhabdus]|nr:hypothetical protein CKY03_05410 [Photorhabdus sp. S9-53]RAX02387.1 hypothetical protein CKY05_04235 [Photorhabdus sp. S10-54]RAX05426.1 hypothetical protein CKY04_04230 [Photorhabdus sp. S8-52]